MCFIDVPNLKDIDPWEGYFYVVQVFFERIAKKNVKKIGQFYIFSSHTINPISFKFDMYDHAYICRA